MKKDIEINYDFVVPLQVKKTFTIKAKVKRVIKHVPKIFID